MEGEWDSGHLSTGISGLLLWGVQVKHGFLPVRGHHSALGLEIKKHTS